MVLPFPVCLTLAKASKIGKQNNTVEGSPSTVTENQQVAERLLCHFLFAKFRFIGELIRILWMRHSERSRGIFAPIVLQI